MSNHTTPAPIIDEGELLTVQEVAKILKVDSTSVKRWIKLGALEAIALPHYSKRLVHRIRKSTVEALLESTTKGIHA